MSEGSASEKKVKQAVFTNPAGAEANWRSIAERCETSMMAAELAAQSAGALAASADPDAALNHLERFVAASPDAPQLLKGFIDRPTTLHRLLLLLAGSPFYSGVLIQNPEYFALLSERAAEKGGGIEDQEASTSGPVRSLAHRLKGELEEKIAAAAGDDSQLLKLFRRVRRRELLKIAFRDLVLGQPLESVVRSISDVADQIINAALSAALEKTAARHGWPKTSAGKRARITLIGMGKLGGRELNYSSDVDFIAVFEEEGMTDGARPLENSEYFAAALREFIRLLQSSTPDGVAYRVDFRLRPHGSQSALCQSMAATLSYYEREGRTWERQAFVKARAIAGSKRLGALLLDRLEDFVFRGQLTFVEINEIQSIKAKIEAHTQAAGRLESNMKTGRGGIRDVEFVVQFLQLLNGSRLPEIRDRNTLTGLSKLAEAKIIHTEERGTLENGYRFLRKVEHLVQIQWDLQTHELPSEPDEIRRLAIRMGYIRGDDPAARFLADLAEVVDRNRAVLHRLMLDLFPKLDDDRGTAAGDPAANLLLDANPTAEEIHNVLAPYGFQNIDTAYRNLELLAREEIPFLSSLRARFFLANIARRLLAEIAAAPDPDMALTNLEKVSASIGAKGVLWESISLNHSLLRLYVQMCAWSRFLSEILINNPGMIDDLLDTLAMARTPTRAELDSDLDQLLRGAKEIDPILHGFRNAKLLAVGICDVLGKMTVRQATRELSDLAEVIIRHIAELRFRELVAVFGVPMTTDEFGKPSGRPARYAVVGLGKFGGRELGYHSDLDLVLVYEGDGQTLPASGAAAETSTDNFHFYSELAQRIVRTASWMGPLGRLYPIDLRLRPTGGSGSLVSPLDRFEEYYRRDAQPWEFQALTRARVVHGEPTFAWRVGRMLRGVLSGFRWKTEFIDVLWQMRKKLEASRSKSDLKRGPGGLVDVEFAVQLMQLKYGAQHPEIVRPNVWDGLERIAQTNLWPTRRVVVFREGYTFLRRVECRIRIVQNLASDHLPENPIELRKLALRVGEHRDDSNGSPNNSAGDAGENLKRDVEQSMKKLREEFLAVLDEERAR